MVYKNKKLSDGIYCIKLDDEKIMVCLIGKSVKDFKASYEKMKNSKANKENRENQEKSNKQESLIKNSDIKAINNKTIREWRTMKVNKEKVKSVVKKAVVLIAASLTTISLFACGGKIETKMEYPSISIDQDVNTGNDSKVKVTEETLGGGSSGETKQYKQRQLKKGESLDGKTTGRTRIENGLVMEWQEDFNMDKTIVPNRVEYRDTGHSLIYNVNGVDITVRVSAKYGGREFTTGPSTRDTFATITEGVNKSNEQVLKSVAAADAIEKAMKAMTK